jgi:phospholipid/cholesterol/gamma-HCH transport system substrate-binding protein
MMGRRLIIVASLLVCAIGVSSCAKVSLDNLPQPGRSVTGSYDIVFEFANVLNLPDRAKVVMDGTTVGVVDRVSLGKDNVEVTAHIDKPVRVPSNVQVALQQATVLGDIYVALARPPGGPISAPDLTSGARVPLSQTTSPPQLEDTLVRLATFLASGSIQRVQSTIIRINRITPEQHERIRAIASRVSADLADLATNDETLDKWVDGFAQTVGVLAARTPQFRHWFSPTGMVGWDRTTFASTYISILLPSIGSVYTGGFWLVPLFDSLGNALGAVQKTKWAIEGEYRPWRKLFTELFLPADKYPAMNITSVQTSDGREISGNVHDVLRMLGAVP